MRRGQDGQVAPQETDYWGPENMAETPVNLACLLWVPFLLVFMTNQRLISHSPWDEELDELRVSHVGEWLRGLWNENRVNLTSTHRVCWGY